MIRLSGVAFAPAAIILIFTFIVHGRAISANDIGILREEVREMFYHAYNNYMNHAFPHDELLPLSCLPRDPVKESRGHLDDTLGNFSLTLVDCLDTLAIMGDFQEFERAVHLLSRHLNFNQDRTVSVFETTIRVLGGLLSGHIIAEMYSDRFVKPYEGDLLRLAEDLGTRLLPAFLTPTGIPFHRVNLVHGVPQGETYEACVAGAGTLMLEFGVLSRLTGNSDYETVAARAVKQIWRHRSKLDLVGNTINIVTGKWARAHAGIGAGVDSFYEYLLKTYILFGDQEFYEMFNKSYDAVQRHVKRDGWYLEVDIKSAQLTKEWIDSMQAFWPALQVLYGDVNEAIDMHGRLYAIWKAHGFLPEGFHIKQMQPLVGYGGYPLRPEFAESTFFLYQATRDPYYLKVGQDIVSSLQRITRVKCGFAAVGDPISKRLEDRMDSFFLSETLKYLYLLFDDGNPFGTGDWLFSTEGHPLPISMFQNNKSTKVTDTCELPPDYTQPIFSTELAMPEPSVAKFSAHPDTCAAGSSPVTITIQETPGYDPLPFVTVRTKLGDVYGVPAAIGAPFPKAGIKGRLVLADPPTACTDIWNGGKVKGSILVVWRNTALFTMNGSGDQVESSLAIPMALISLSDGQRLQDVSGQQATVFASEEYSPADMLRLPAAQEQAFIEIKLQPSLQVLDQTSMGWLLQELAKLGIQSQNVLSLDGKDIRPFLQHMQSNAQHIEIDGMEESRDSPAGGSLPSQQSSPKQSQSTKKELATRGVPPENVLSVNGKSTASLSNKLSHNQQKAAAKQKDLSAPKASDKQLESGRTSVGDKLPPRLAKKPAAPQSRGGKMKPEL